jgi:hypothetical protein
MPAALRLDVIGLHYGVPNFRHSLRFLQKIPDVCTHGIETVVNAVLDVQNCSFTAEVTRYLISGDNYYRLLRKTHVRPPRFPTPILGLGAVHTTEANARRARAGAGRPHERDCSGSTSTQQSGSLGA